MCVFINGFTLEISQKGIFKNWVLHRIFKSSLEEQSKEPFKVPNATLFLRMYALQGSSIVYLV